MLSFATSQGRRSVAVNVTASLLPGLLLELRAFVPPWGYASVRSRDRREDMRRPVRGCSPP